MDDQNHNGFLAARRKYYVNQLRNKLAAYFRINEYQVDKKYPFILADRDNWDLNIIDKRVAYYIKGIKEEKGKNKKPFPIHKYIHHGLSSQALLFNLLVPLMIDSRFEVFDAILRKADIITEGKVSDVHLELEDRIIFNETSAQPTSIDLAISTDQNEQIFIEFKFTESEFGGCSLFPDGDCDGRNPANNFDMCYLHSVRRKYWQLMKKYGLLTDVVSKESRCPFMDLYQAYRVLLFSLEKGGEFLLMYDERNPAFYYETQYGPRGAFARFLEYLPTEIRIRCHKIGIRQVIEVIEAQVDAKWVEKVKEKYF